MHVQLHQWCKYSPLISMGSFKHKPFYLAIRFGMTETGLFMANSYPHAIQMVVTVRGRNALHYACIRGFTDMILQFVLLCPAAAAVTDDYNYLPLHYACEHHPLLPQHVIQNLVNAYPLACSKICPNLTFRGYDHIAQGSDWMHLIANDKIHERSNCHLLLIHISISYFIFLSKPKSVFFISIKYWFVYL